MNRKKLKEKLEDQRLISRAQWVAAMVIIPMALASDQAFSVMNLLWAIVLYYMVAFIWMAAEQVVETLKGMARHEIIQEMKYEKIVGH
jgi:hypothetical protein